MLNKNKGYMNIILYYAFVIKFWKDKFLLYIYLVWKKLLSTFFILIFRFFIHSLLQCPLKTNVSEEPVSIRHLTNCVLGP